MGKGKKTPSGETVEHRIRSERGPTSKCLLLNRACIDHFLSFAASRCKKSSKNFTPAAKCRLALL